MTETREKPRLLLLDANRSRKELLGSWLQNEDYQTEYFFNTALFLNALAAEHAFAGPSKKVLGESLLLVFPDRREGSAAELCTEIRRCCKLPLILLLDTEDAMERIAALTLGADVVLPAATLPLELLAQIRALTRRIHSSRKTEGFLENPLESKNPSAFLPLPAEIGVSESTAPKPQEEGRRLGNLYLHPKSRTACCKDTPLPLTPKEFDFLLILLHRNAAVPKEELLRLVWRQEQAGTSSQEDLVKRLRKKLRDFDADVSLETIRGYGYRLVQSV